MALVLVFTEELFLFPKQSLSQYKQYLRKYAFIFWNIVRLGGVCKSVCPVEMKEM